MRICHLSDSHLGAGEGHSRRGASGLTLRQEDIINSFVAGIDRIIELKPDVCIHAGDLFHVVRPLNRIMAIAGEQLHRLAAVAGIPTVIITGNHDAPKQPHIGAALEVYRQIDNLYVSASTRLQTFDIGNARFFALPHCLTSQIQKDELAKCVPDRSKEHNVLIMHGVAAGMPEFSMADLGEQELPIDVMERFDYTALGHFHNYCRVAERSYYAGSTERLSQSERESAKGFVEVTLNPFGVVFHEVACREMIDMTPIDATGQRGDELASLIREQLAKVDSSDKIVRVKVKGVTEETMKTIPADVIADLRQKSFALDISFEKQKSTQDSTGFGRSAIGKLDKEFLRFLDTIDLKEFDADRLRQMALTYLSEEE